MISRRTERLARSDAAEREVPLSAPGLRLTLASLPAALALALALMSTSEGPAVATDPTLVVDPNTAPPGVLLALPRLGPAVAGRIVDGRVRRPFRSSADLQARVRGVGPVTSAALRPHLLFPATERTGTPTPDRRP